MDLTDDDLSDLGRLFDARVTFGRETWLGERRVFVGESGQVWLTYDAARQLVAAFRAGRVPRDA